MEVNVSLPTFRLEFENEISADMHVIGAKKVFRSRADFSGMTSGGSVPVSEVIEMNKEGTEATAVIGILWLFAACFKWNSRLVTHSCLPLWRKAARSL
ncbi:Serpin B7 like protein [Argiope bruennichi]|uniref:Serpin B7 like protein n=1 Tax=Argiope bruennichi TaxID=94029 RepID=A0A8T0EIZ3_ARGBR|nr:Serpin B7 like protein [Argiope bruennichi]